LGVRWGTASIVIYQESILEIYRDTWGDEEDESGEFVTADFRSNGSLIFTKVDFGETTRKFKGQDDWAYIVFIDGEDVQKFTLELLKTSFNSRRSMTVSRVERICRNAGISYQTATD
jgi:hypothetical protein